jgi:hypothetical protein
MKSVMISFVYEASIAETTIERRVLELDLNLTAEQALAECHRRGLVVTSQRELAGRAGSTRWHLRIPGHAGTLELNEWQCRVWVKVHPLRESTWVRELARELAQQRKPA